MEKRIKELITNYEIELAQLELSIFKNPYSGYYQGCQDKIIEIIASLEEIINFTEDCGTCKHNAVSKYVAPCYGCRDNGGYDHYKSDKL